MYPYDYGDTFEQGQLELLPELMYSGTFYDRLKAKNVIDTIDSALSSIGKSGAVAKSEYGELAFLVPYPNVVSETHKIKLLSSVLDRYGGYIWVKYTQTTVFEDGREFVYPMIRLRLSVENNEDGVLNVTKARIYSIYKR